MSTIFDYFRVCYYINMRQEILLAQLQDLHLSPNEAKVYLAVLEIGQTSIGEVMKKTGLHRSVLYETFNKLIGRKLVFKLTKQSVAHFQATDPERILDNAKTELSIAESLIPQLKQLKTTSLPEITTYEGVESYRKFWIESPKRMKPNSVDYVAGSIGAPWIEILGQAGADKFIRDSAARGITWKMIVFDIDDLEQSFLKRYPEFKVEYRHINKNVSKEGNFNIFGNESVILHSAVEPMIIEVKNPSLVRVFQNIFDLMWEGGEPVKL